MMEEIKKREQKIVKTSIIGIIVNFILAGVKILIGIITGAISVLTDAINNFTDSISSLVTIIGTKLAKKGPTKKHPFGFGRIEYFASLIISIIVLYAGITFLVESIKKIGNSEELDYKIYFLIVLGFFVLVKVALGLFYINVGKKNNAKTLIDSGKDALMDAIISTTTVISGIIFLTTSFSIEAYLGILISLFVIRNGIKMILETISTLLGEKNDPEIALKLKKEILEYDNVYGVYDIIINNYGPESNNVSLHIEVDANLEAHEIDKLTRKITTDMYMRHHVLIVAIGVYAKEADEECLKIKKSIQNILLMNPYVLEFHGFYIDHDTNTIRFDIVISLDCKDRNKEYETICKVIQAEYPDYKVEIVMDQYF